MYRWHKEPLSECTYKRGNEAIIIWRHLLSGGETACQYLELCQEFHEEKQEGRNLPTLSVTLITGVFRGDSSEGKERKECRAAGILPWGYFKRMVPWGYFRGDIFVGIFPRG